MSDSSDLPWSNSPNAPQLPYFLYKYEKGYIAGSIIAVILYGIVVALFFQCMSALLLPVHFTRKNVQWGLVAHTVAMFSILTIGVGMNRYVFSMSYIDGREFTGIDGLLPGPIGYESIVFSTPRAFGYAAYFVNPLNQWLADGFLLYRCSVIYSKNYWAIALPFLVYLASIGTGILWLYHAASLNGYSVSAEITYFIVCLLLNVLLTLMIIARLVLHRRNIRNAIGASFGAGGMYASIITMLVESAALYAIGYLLYIVSFASNGYAGYIFTPPLGEIQVIAPFMIILRVANRSALTSDAVTTGNVGSLRFESEGDSTGDSTDSNGETSERFGVGPQDT